MLLSAVPVPEKKEPVVKKEETSKTVAAPKKEEVAKTPEPVKKEQEGSYPVYHKVGKKETLYHISKLYNN